jgi:pilus assembly protein Flp/PilA
MMNILTHLVLRLKNDRRGVTALEYGLIASLVAVALIAGATTLGTSLSTTFAAIAGKI